MPDDEATSLLTKLRSAAKSQTMANSVAFLALAVSILSIYFARDQAAAARDANYLVRETQARNVFIEIVDPIAQSKRYQIVNNNPELVANVYYTYSVDGRNANKIVDVGLLPGCHSVQLTPRSGDNERADFEPIAVFFIDPSGTFWKRVFKGPLARIDEGRVIPSRDSTGEIVKVANCRGAD